MSDEWIAKRARSFRHHGQQGTHRHARLGVNSRLDEGARHPLGRHPPPSPRRVERASARHCGGVSARNPASSHVLPVEPPAARACWQLFPALFEGVERNDFVGHLSRRGVASGVHNPTLIPGQPAWPGGAPFSVAGTLKSAARFARSGVSLLVQPFLTDAVVDA